MLTFTKENAVKYVDHESTLIDVLRKNGWKVEGEKDVDEELEALRAEAELLGLKVHHKTGVDKLRELIAEAARGE